MQGNQDPMKESIVGKVRESVLSTSLSEGVLRSQSIHSEETMGRAHDLAVAYFTTLKGLSLNSTVQKRFQAAAFALRISRWYSDISCLA